jgi:hypothetical protein
MPSARPRRPLLAVLAAGAVLAAPARSAAAVEGPGYGGGADRLSVQWQRDAATRQRAIGLYAVGFRGGSAVQVRVGSAPERTVTADETGSLRLMLVAADLSAGGRLASGTTISVVGRTPSGSTRALIAAVPPSEAGGGAQDLARWGIPGAVVLALGAGMVLRGRAASVARAVRRGRPAEDQGSKR